MISPSFGQLSDGSLREMTRAKVAGDRPGAMPLHRHISFQAKRYKKETPPKRGLFDYLPIGKPAVISVRESGGTQRPGGAPVPGAG